MSDFGNYNSLLKYEEGKQQINKSKFHKKLMDINKSDIEMSCCFFTLLRKIPLLLLAMYPQREIFVFIQSHFVRDFSFCFKDVFFGLFGYSKENIGKYNLICFLLAKFYIRKKKKKSVSKPFFLIQS